MEISGNKFRLSTGREIRANKGFVGINDRLEVAEGYDGPIEGLRNIDGPQDTWSESERAELADYMIDLWQRFKLG